MKIFTSIAGGVIDSDYTGNIILIFQNYSNNWLQIRPSEKIAQIAIQKKALNVVYEEVKNFDDITEREEIGFGSDNKTSTQISSTQIVYL